MAIGAAKGVGASGGDHVHVGATLGQELAQGAGGVLEQLGVVDEQNLRAVGRPDRGDGGLGGLAIGGQALDVSRLAQRRAAGGHGRHDCCTDGDHRHSHRCSGHPQSDRLPAAGDLPRPGLSAALLDHAHLHRHHTLRRHRCDD